jgi:hypothetical protein
MSRKLFWRFRRRSKDLEISRISIEDSASTLTTSTYSASRGRKKRSDGSDGAEKDSSATGEGESTLIHSQEARVNVLPGTAPFSLPFHRPSYFVNPFESITPTPVPTPASTSPSPVPQITKVRKNLTQESSHAATDDEPHFFS